MEWGRAALRVSKSGRGSKQEAEGKERSEGVWKMGRGHLERELEKE